MGSSRPGTGDDAGFADEVGAEHQDRDNLADWPAPRRLGVLWYPC